MATLETVGIISNDVWIDHPHGRIFARTWSNALDPHFQKEKAAIVLFHDSLGCVDLWREFPAELCAATGRQVVAYDRLGFGKSAPRTDKLAMDFIADEAKTFFPVVREQLGLERFIVFGHSVGGGIAVNYAAQDSSRCMALITESAQAFAAEETLQGIRVAKRQFEDPAQLERLWKYHGEKAKWVLDAWTETWLAPEFAPWSLANVLPQVNCPVLAIHGVFDEYGSTRHPEMIGRLCGGQSRVEVLEDAHHVPHKEKPEMVIAVVTEFASSVQ
ncbi:MAG TPA: alpha/beta fold hydrolase [Noviherbaspirillum sp.]|nr:alpha/beta fold hydrolase [Noviherbaspirillum sp.]